MMKKEEKRGALYRALENFKNAYMDLVEAIDVVDEDDVDVITEMLGDDYPFESSFDDLGICDWVDTIQDKMMETFK